MKRLMSYKVRWAAVISLLMIMALGIVGTVSAAEFPKGETIPAGQTIDDDVFITGMNVVVDGTINGNLFASGNTVTLNGQVSGDAVLMGERVILNEGAYVEGNLFAGGAELVIDGQVAGSIFGGSASMIFGNSASAERNLYYGGFSLETEGGSQIGKDLYAAAYQTILSGSVDRDLGVSAAAVELNGQVGRNARIDVGTVESAQESITWMQINPYTSRYIKQTIAPGIRFAQTARIDGKLTYTSSVQQIDRVDEVVAGSVAYQTPMPYETTASRGEAKPFQRGFPAGVLWGTALLNMARNFIRLMVLGALALWLLNKPFQKLIDAAYAEPLKALGWGFVLLAVGFLAVLVVPLTFVMVGIILGFFSLGSLLYVWFGIVGTTLLLAFMLFFFFVFTISKILASFMLGRWLMKTLFKIEKENIWLSLLLGVFLYVMVRSIPVVGWLAGLAATLIGSGAFWLAYLTKKTAE